jgi:glutamate--cysteine ligase
MTTLKTELSPRLRYLIDHHQQHLLGNGLKGIEKESLRISRQGLIAQTDHPRVLGSALTHPYITTDYSEALMEFITPPFANISETLNFMQDIHQFVYQNLDEEMLLASSMPCGIDGDESIRIAEYGSSNIGRMKHIYRRGLWHRYGRTMQAIAGVHFNYSVPLELWSVLHQMQASELSLDEFIAKNYFGMIRNFQRQGWLILYLFGASPAICKQFFKSRPQLMAQFEEFDACTVYHPYATSLRMSDIGYKSKNQANLNIKYNCLGEYVNSLSAAINTPYPEYEAIGVKVAGEYQQLNSNILQIENEFYSTIRPKQIIQSGEKPTLALKRRGICYLEVRSLDLDVFNPIGVDENTCRFVEAFLLSCLLTESPLQGENEHIYNNSNQLIVANQGRKSGIALNRNGEQIPLQTWAMEIIENIAPICELLDVQDSENSGSYCHALEIQRQRVENPELTPSAQVLAQMAETNQCFGEYGLNASTRNAAYFKDRILDADTLQKFKDLSIESLQQQQELEANDNLGLDEFLARYFAQH